MFSPAVTKYRMLLEYSKGILEEKFMVP